MLISHVVFDETVTAVATTGTLVAIAWVWFGAPLLRQLREGL
jgi:hypothetical protein